MQAEALYSTMSDICSQMCTGRHVKYLLFLSDFNES